MAMEHHNELLTLEAQLTSMSLGRGFADLGAALLPRLDLYKPTELVSTHQYAIDHRKIIVPGGGTSGIDPTLTPYIEGMHNACDDPLVRIVAVLGPARTGKTLAAENKLLKAGEVGPPEDVIWYLHDDNGLGTYLRKNVERLFSPDLHPILASKLGSRPQDRALASKMVDGMLWEWFAASQGTLRNKTASFIVGDEIDQWKPALRGALLTLVKARQREYGANAFAYLASHPDAGWNDGITKIIKDSDRRLWFVRCPRPSCRKPSTHAQFAEKGQRMTWNVEAIIRQLGDGDRSELLDLIAHNVRLVCPHCRNLIDNDTRLEIGQIENGAAWIGNGQKMLDDGAIAGKLIQNPIAGFVIHSFMGPFVPLSELARDWAKARFQFDDTEDDRDLREVTVKTIGEIYEKPGTINTPKRWKDIKARLVDTGYRLKTVPRGVRFLTAEVDVQGGRFEVAVIGWDEFRQSWLVDRFAIRQREGMVDVSPKDNLEDWNLLENAVLHQRYPMQGMPGWEMGIAKLVVDSGGEPGVTDNARRWLTQLYNRPVNPIPQWRAMLTKGDAHNTNPDLYDMRPGKPERDETGKAMERSAREKIINVIELKRIIERRMMEVDTPGPGFMHLPADLHDRYWRELASEQFINGVWSKTGANETWDQWVMAEVARAWLMKEPDRIKFDWSKGLPAFAKMLIFSPEQQKGERTAAASSKARALARQKDGSVDTDPPQQVSEFFNRLKRVGHKRGRDEVL